MNKKKVLFIMPSMFIGGAERSLLGLLDSFDYDRYDVDLFLYRHEGEFLNLIPDNVRVLPEKKQYKTFDVPISGLLKSSLFAFGFSRVIGKISQKLHSIFSKEPSGVWMSMQYISKSLQWLLPKIEGKYDCAVSFLGIPDVLLNKVNADVKIAWNHTDYTILNPNHKYDRKLYSKLDYIASVSENCTKQFLSVYPEFEEKAITVENILSERILNKQAEEKVSDFKGNEIRLLSIGRFSYAKNFDNVPDICKIIKNSGLNVKWYLIGYGGDEPIIREKIKEYGMENDVIILGKKVNPYPYIKACDLYVQPSRYEGKCVTVREAQILHKPVVITNYATSGSQLTDGFDGVVVPMDNQGCAEGIIKVLNDEELMKTLSENTKKVDYTNSKEVEKLYSIMGD